MDRDHLAQLYVAQRKPCYVQCMAEHRSPDPLECTPGTEHPGSAPSAEAVETFVHRWEQSGASERANYQLFLSELCDTLGVARPDPTVPDSAANGYVFERAVTFHHGDGSSSSGRIDLYKRGSFVLEAKQGATTDTDGTTPARRGHGLRDTPAWDDAMVRARGQAEQYLRALPADEPTPPFLVVVDVGYSIELFADFTRSGRTFLPFPDARSHRIRLQTLSNPDIRERLRLVWDGPDALDPARRSARVTREIAAHLASLARELEINGHSPDDVAHFLMRCLFTMFAEDVGLLPERSFTGLLEELKTTPEKLAPMLQNLWHTMNMGGFSPVLREALPRFNGGLFESVHAIPVTAPQLELLLEAARADWQDVEPAIFGTLLERALDPDERHALGAHFTPRAYVERLVMPTVIEPLREEWQGVFTAAATLARDDKANKAQCLVRDFLDRLCEVKVLDPACGTGNFLYVTLEHLKRLEGEVVDALEGFGDTQGRLDLAGQTVDPHQLLGLEINPRAVAIAELVLWIGYLQWHLRNRSTAPPEPILRAFHTIECRDAVMAYDFPPQPRRDENGQPVTQWDGKTFKKHPVTGEDMPDDSARIPVWYYPNARPAEWPEADFVVGNPPFIGNKRMRTELGDGYVETLRNLWPKVPGSADYVMYWWHRSAELTRARKLERFGLITTKGITQTFNRKVLQLHIEQASGLSIVFAIPNHPWVDAADGADVRVALTVGTHGQVEGLRLQVISEVGNSGEAPNVTFRSKRGSIRSNLRVGPNVITTKPLVANRDLCLQGCKLVGSGFLLDEDGKKAIAVQCRDPEAFLPLYVSGRDLVGHTNSRYVVDFFGLSEPEARERFPAGFQLIRDRVKPERDQNKRKTRRVNWWLFGENAPKLRRACQGLNRFIGTSEVAKHRAFVFLPLPGTLADGSLAAIASDNGCLFGVLSSRIHSTWSFAAGGRLGIGNDPRYQNGPCFLPFPFVSNSSAQAAHIRELAEQLDAHRKRQQAAYPGLTLTDMYNGLEKLRIDEPLTDREREVHEQGLVSVMAEVHDRLDEAVLEAYGWSDLAPALVGKPGGTTPNPNIEPEQAEAEEELLARLVALNAERTKEEDRGLIRWLRPDFQAPDQTTEPAHQDELFDTEKDAKPAARPTAKKDWPKDLAAQANAVHEALVEADQPITAKGVARRFKGARTTTVTQILETLAALGHAREGADGRFVA